jgi:2-keto-4-pentenoate hydratase/2-oxohepta-3-ene-1,7-dioic acid hydratase in catechol pathway
MRYCRFQFQGQAQYGSVESVNGVLQITRLLVSPPEESGSLQNITTKRIEPVFFSEAKLLAPVRPSKIICVGRNYRAHAAEMGGEVPKEPLIFFKPPSSLIAAGETIRRPKASKNTHYEGELGVVIAKTCHKLPSQADLRPYILGYTAVNDITARDLQKTDSQWTRAKGFDTFCPVGPLVTDEIDPWTGVGIETRVNGEIHQNGNTRDFVFSLDALIHYISGIMTLLPGDLISTGTPEGVGPFVAGDVLEVSVEGVGTLRNPAIDE